MEFLAESCNAYHRKREPLNLPLVKMLHTGNFFFCHCFALQKTVADIQGFHKFCCFSFRSLAVFLVEASPSLAIFQVSILIAEIRFL